MAAVVTPGNLGNEFDLGIIEAGKIHVNFDGTSIVRNAGTGVVSAVAPATTNTLSAAAPNLTSTVNGVVATIDLPLERIPPALKSILDAAIAAPAATLELSRLPLTTFLMATSLSSTSAHSLTPV